MRRDLDALLAQGPELTREALLSLALHREIAAALLRDPDRVLVKARRNMQTMRRVDERGGSGPWLDEWDRLLNADLSHIREAMLDPSSDRTDLRQCSPFAGVLDERLRQQVIREVRAVWTRSRSEIGRRAP